MLSLVRTLSLRHVQQRWARTALIVATIMLGVAILVATQALNVTMSRAVRGAASPLAGGADLVVTAGEGFLPADLKGRVQDVPGVRKVRPILLAPVQFPQLKEDGRDTPGLLVGFEDISAFQGGPNPWGIKADVRGVPGGVNDCLVGEELYGRLQGLGEGAADTIEVRPAARRKAPVPLHCLGTVSARGAAAALSGNVVFTLLPTANDVMGQGRGTASRLDLVLEPGADPAQVRRRVEARLGGRARVKTPEELVQTTQNVMTGMQAGFTLSGLGALVVGMFLVYNALSVSVAERRHEIGVLRSLGATRGQVRALFAGEAAAMGLLGAALGVPVGLALAHLALGPMTRVVSDIYFALPASRVEWTLATVLTALAAGLLTALLAALVPAFRASVEEPAAAVRRIPPRPTWRHRFLQVALSGLLIALGVGLILVRDELPERRVGSYGGLTLVLLGALLATPLLAAVAARLVQPVARRCFGIEARLAADNLVRSPARTGLVIAALAAGVALMVQTAGTIRSNRDSVDDWVRRYITADLIVTAGSPVSAGQNQAMEPGVGEELRRFAPGQVRAVVPLRFRRRDYANTQVFVMALDARQCYEANKDRRPGLPGIDLFRRLAEQPGSAIISDNFHALHGLGPGDVLPLEHARLKVLGLVLDYSWNHGVVYMDWADYCRHFPGEKDQGVDVFDIYLAPGADPGKVREAIPKSFRLEKGLVVLTHAELRQRIAEAIERLYGIAYAQQLVVGIVAALGVVTALLISVLQRRREMGVLRAVGATRFQVVRSVLAEAALMGLIGTAIGLVVGIPLEWYILQVIILEESGYLFPVAIPWAEAGLIAGAAVAVATLAGLWPALRTMRHRIPEAIAHE